MGACGHTNDVTCSNCQGLYKESGNWAEEMRKVMPPNIYTSNGTEYNPSYPPFKSKDLAMTIEKADNGVIIKVNGKIHLVELNYDELENAECLGLWIMKFLEFDAK